MTQLSFPFHISKTQLRYTRYIALNKAHSRAKHTYYFSRAIRLSDAIKRLARVGLRVRPTIIQTQEKTS